MRDHKGLDVWKLSMDIVEDVYKVTVCFPKEEIFGLTAQMRRAAVSIPSNISEGAARNGEKEFVHFLHMALGSAAELETQLIISQRLAYVADISSLVAKLDSVQKLICGLIRH